MYLIGSSLATGFFRVNWNLEMLVFEERGKPEYPEKNLSEQGREPMTKSTHI